MRMKLCWLTVALSACVGDPDPTDGVAGTTTGPVSTESSATSDGPDGDTKHESEGETQSESEAESQTESDGETGSESEEETGAEPEGGFCESECEQCQNQRCRVP